MSNPKFLSTSTFNYYLPDANIAQHPLEQRDLSRLLLYKQQQITDLRFSDLPSQLPAGFTLVFNDTKVIKARVLCQKVTGANIEIFCLEPVQPNDYGQMFSSTQAVVWKCIVGNFKKWKSEPLVKTLTIDGTLVQCTIELIANEGSHQLIRFSWNAACCFAQVLQEIGNIPIPPYLQRSATDNDTHRYQTVYAQWQGSVAAPTAGLHFTESILQKLRNNGISTTQLTLHVGAGTFKPMKADFLGEHDMHKEHCIVQLEQLQQIVKSVLTIVAVGTTSVRTLESLYWIGVKLLSGSDQPFSLGQWELYETLPSNISANDSLQALCTWMNQNNRTFIEFDTSLMIVPGYRFRTIKGIITNFHQPQSTLLLLVAAAIGNDWQRVYAHALDQKYRFLSYGDSSLLWINQND